MKVIIINGKPTAGKSSFVDTFRFINDNTVELSMVDFVKEIADYAGWKHEKTEEGRKFLADIKDSIDRYNKNIIYKHIDDDIQYWNGVYSYCNEEKNLVFFINARSSEDIDYLKNKYNAVTLYIDNPRVPELKSNHADKNVNNYIYDYYVVNDGTLDDLIEKAKKFREYMNNEFEDNNYDK